MSGLFFESESGLFFQSPVSVLFSFYCPAFFLSFPTDLISLGSYLSYLLY